MSDDTLKIKLELDSSGLDADLDKAIKDPALQKSISNLSDKINSLTDSLEKISINTGEISTSFKKMNESAGNLEGGLASVLSGFLKLSAVSVLLAGATYAFASFRNSVYSFVSSISSSTITGITSLFTVLTKAIALNIVKLLNIGAISGETSIALNLLGDALIATNTELGIFAGVLTNKMSLAFGGLSLGIAALIYGISHLATSLGDYLVAAFDKTIEKFAKLENQTIIYNNTIENFNRITNGATGSVDQFNDKINYLSDSLNISIYDLQKAAVEIVSVGSKLGLTSGQMEELLQISSEYAKLNKEDVYNASVKFGSALNGNSQAVLGYGIKLGEANLQQHLFKEGSNKLFGKMSENQKVQERYNYLVEQYAGIAGIAAKAADSFSGQNERLNVSIEKIQASLGAGVAKIENLNILTYLANKAVSLFSGSVYEAIGFIGDLGARLLQVIGTLISFTSKVYLAYYAFNLLKTLLQSETYLVILNKNITILGTSIAQLALKSGYSIKDLQTLGGVVSLFSRTVINAFSGIMGAMAGTGAASAGFGAVATGIFTRITIAARALGTVLLTVIRGPFFLISIAVTAAILLFNQVANAFSAVEAKTGALSQAWEALVSVFNDAKSVFDPLRFFLEYIKNVALDALNRFVGLLAYGIAGVVKLAATIAQTQYIKKFFSKEALDNLTDASKKLDKFQDDLIKTGFRISETADLPSKAKESKLIPTINPQDIINLQNQLENAGLTELQILQKTRDQRLDLINKARQEELLTEENHSNLKKLILLDYADKASKILTEEQKLIKQKNDSINSAIGSGLSSLTSNLAQQWGATLVGLGNSWEDFGKIVLGILGDLMIQVGTAIVVASTAVEAFKTTLTTLFGGFGIAGGLALIALGGALKAFGSGGLAGPAVSGGTTGGGGSTSTTAITQKPEVEQQKAGPTINVNIQGDVLDSDEAGLRVIDLISKAYSQQGAVIRGMA